MTRSSDEETSDPLFHAGRLRRGLSGLIEHMRADVTRVREPRFQALLETSAEVLGGVRTAFQHYGEGHEPAFRATGRQNMNKQTTDTTMPKGDKSSYTDKQKRQATHIEKGYEKKGVTAKTAKKRAWATVNKTTGGGRKASGGSKGRASSRA